MKKMVFYKEINKFIIKHSLCATLNLFLFVSLALCVHWARNAAVYFWWNFVWIAVNWDADCKWIQFATRISWSLRFEKLFASSLYFLHYYFYQRKKKKFFKDTNGVWQYKLLFICLLIPKSKIFVLSFSLYIFLFLFCFVSSLHLIPNAFQ